jgi:hypothetical protein
MTLLQSSTSNNCWIIWLRLRVNHLLQFQVLQQLEQPIQSQILWQVVRRILAQALLRVQALEDPLKQDRVALLQAQLPRLVVVRHILAQALWRAEALAVPLRQGRAAGAVDLTDLVAAIQSSLQGCNIFSNCG